MNNDIIKGIGIGVVATSGVMYAAKRIVGVEKCNWVMAGVAVIGAGMIIYAQMDKAK